MTPVSVLAVPPPPPSANRMGSDDPDEITSWVSRRDGDHSRVVHGTGPYGFRLARIETPSRADRLGQYAACEHAARPL